MLSYTLGFYHRRCITLYTALSHAALNSAPLKNSNIRKVVMCNALIEHCGIGRPELMLPPFASKHPTRRYLDSVRNNADATEVYIPFDHHMRPKYAITVELKGKPRSVS